MFKNIENKRPKEKLFEVIGDDYTYIEHLHYFEFETNFGFSLHGYDNKVRLDFIPTDESSPDGKKYIVNINEVDEELRDNFKRNSALKFFKSLITMIDFIKNNPESNLAKVDYITGVTNKHMAKFLNSRFGIEPLTYSENKKLNKSLSFIKSRILRKKINYDKDQFYEFKVSLSHIMDLMKKFDPKFINQIRQKEIEN